LAIACDESSASSLTSFGAISLPASCVYFAIAVWSITAAIALLVLCVRFVICKEGVLLASSDAMFKFRFTEDKPSLPSQLMSLLPDLAATFAGLHLFKIGDDEDSDSSSK
jgi:hypothetical protein